MSHIFADSCQCSTEAGASVVKQVVEVLSLLAGAVAAIFAAWNYWRNSQLERIKWVAELFKKFFESDQYTQVRRTLDNDPNSDPVVALFSDRNSEEFEAFTDYLNFFELVAYLARERQIKGKDVLVLFDYYLGCLSRHDLVMGEVAKKQESFEQLKELLEERRKSKPS